MLESETAPQNLSVERVTYRFRFCERCRREWASEETQCRTCARWLGDAPLERFEWQISPITRAHFRPITDYRRVSTAALTLRIVTPELLEAHVLLASTLLRQLLVAPVLGVEHQGWLFWRHDDAHRMLRDAIAVSERLQEGRPGVPRVRWGFWGADYVLPCDAQGVPVVSDTLAAAIFTFEPDEMLLVSDVVYRANRRWENFVSVPMRFLDGSTAFGFRPLGQKHASALDHRRAPHRSAFRGRSLEQQRLDTWLAVTATTAGRFALFAPAGSGKTRLIDEWLGRQSTTPALQANFSLFGNDLASFVGQLVELPDPTDDIDLLVSLVCRRIDRENVRILVCDDLHWADEESERFLLALLSAIASMPVLVLLSSRPSARDRVTRLAPSDAFDLPMLSEEVVTELAEELAPSPRAAMLAAQLSNGNPLFVEQFCAWATETADDSVPPASLADVMSARLGHLEGTVQRLRREASWGNPSQRRQTLAEAAGLEAEIGTWLDRLETGDYVDPTATFGFLERLERTNFDLFLIGVIAGEVRPRSNRLTEAIERLIVGNPEALFEGMAAHLGASGAESLNLCLSAERAGTRAVENYQWLAARRFFALALEWAPPEKVSMLRERIDDCSRRLDANLDALPDQGADNILDWIAVNPAVDPLTLPQVWMELAKRLADSRYCLRAEQAAEVINDRVAAARARRVWILMNGRRWAGGSPVGPTMS